MTTLEHADTAIMSPNRAANATDHGAVNYRRLPVRSSAEWVSHFLRNAEHPLPLDWQAGAALDAHERGVILDSLKAWQLGESGSGTHMLLAARRYAQRSGDAEFPVAAQLFIAEEQRHGALLGRFIGLAGEPCLERQWTDTCFRALRHRLASLELFTTAVIVAETLALVYYRAVYRATRSTLLRGICRQLLKDELHHLRFQYERLAILHRSRAGWALRVTYVLQAALFVSTLITVWFGHRRALRAGGYTFRSYFRAAWQRMRLHWRRMQPSRYVFS